MTENQLLFYLEPKIYPYLDEDKEAAKFIKWGQLQIIIVSASERIILLETEWDLLPLIEWFEQNEQSIKYEVLNNDEVNLFVMNSESFAQALNRLQEKDFSEEEETQQDMWFDTLFEFREHHSLRFGLRGSKVPEIIIGCNNGIGEISLSNEISKWSYKFDMDNFWINFKKKASSFLEKSI